MHPCIAAFTRYSRQFLLLAPLWVLVTLTYLAINLGNHPRLHVERHHQHPHIHGKVKPTEALNLIIQKDDLCQDSNITDAAVVDACANLHEQEKRFFRKRDEKVNPFVHRFLMTSSHICDRGTDVIVLVHSLHTYSDRRRAIRETWAGAVGRKLWPGNYTIAEDVRVAFVLGRHRNSTLDAILSREIETYGDIIQGDFLEDYHNMTLKSLLGLKWVAEYCPSARFLIKSDDDMIINFGPLLQVLRTTNMTQGIMGPHNPKSRVLRKGKWALSYREFPFYYFPEYQSGACYVISKDLVQPLFEASEYVPPIFIDDVYVTGILARIVGARHVLQYGFSYWNSKRPKPCDLVKTKLLTATKMTPEFLLTVWKTITRKKC